MEELIGYIAAFLTTFAFMPQAIKTIRSGDTKSLSLTTYITFVSSMIAWLLYGWLIDQWPIIVSNIITLVFATIILVHKLNEK